MRKRKSKRRYFHYITYCLTRKDYRVLKTVMKKYGKKEKGPFTRDIVLAALESL